MKSHNRPFTRIKVELLEDAIKAADDPKDPRSVAASLCSILEARYGDDDNLEVQLSRIGIETCKDAYDIADEYLRRKKLKEKALSRESGGKKLKERALSRESGRAV